MNILYVLLHPIAVFVVVVVWNIYSHTYMVFEGISSFYLNLAFSSEVTTTETTNQEGFSHLFFVMTFYVKSSNSSRQFIQLSKSHSIVCFVRI